MEKNNREYDPIIFACLYLALHGDGKIQDEEANTIGEIAEILHGDQGEAVVSSTLKVFTKMSLEERTNEVFTVVKTISNLNPKTKETIKLMLFNTAHADNDISEGEAQILDWFGIKVEGESESERETEEEEGEGEELEFDGILFIGIYLVVNGNLDTSDTTKIDFSDFIKIAEDLHGGVGGDMFNAALRAFNEKSIDERDEVINSAAEQIAELDPETKESIVKILLRFALSYGGMTEAKKAILSRFGIQVEDSSGPNKEKVKSEVREDKPKAKEADVVSVKKAGIQPTGKRTKLDSLDDYFNHPMNAYTGKKFAAVKSLVEHLEKTISEEFPSAIFKYSPSGISLYADSGGRSKFAGISINKALAQIVLIRDHRHEYRKPIINGLKAINRVNKLGWIDWYKLELSSINEFVKNEEHVIKLFRESLEMKVKYPGKILKEKSFTTKNDSLLAKYLDPDYTYMVEDLQKDEKKPLDQKKKSNIQENKTEVANEEENEDETGYIPYQFKVFDSPTSVIDKRRNQYLGKWSDLSKYFNGLLGVRAYIPGWVADYDNDNCCPEWNRTVLDEISGNIEKNRIIPSLAYIPEEIFEVVKQVWWICPFVIIANKIASFLFITKNGFYTLYPEDEEISMIAEWGKITGIDYDENWNNEDNLVGIDLVMPNDESLTIVEFVKNGQGSYLKVLHSIYKVYKPVIEASAGKPFWEHGAGDESYKGFDSVKDLEAILGE